VHHGGGEEGGGGAVMADSALVLGPFEYVRCWWWRRKKKHDAIRSTSKESK